MLFIAPNAVKTIAENIASSSVPPPIFSAKYPTAVSVGILTKGELIEPTSPNAVPYPAEASIAFVISITEISLSEI